ncbi:MAG: dihydrodipicolinate reductase C-terminal domain-containing protein [Chitinophagaceae bacterium]
MKVGLMGFGKTGRSVTSVILAARDCSLEWIYRRGNALDHRSASEFLGIESEDRATILSPASIDVDTLLEQHPVDIIIDFSSSEGIWTYGDHAAERGIAIVSAISHYNPEEIGFLQKLALLTTVFWSPNITLGVNYLLFSARLLQKIAPEVDIEIVEEHFRNKQGVSGTAVKIANALEHEHEKINSIRAGGIVGKHEVIFGFPFQTVRLVHESISREAFGNGALFAARHLSGKPAGILQI